MKYVFCVLALVAGCGGATPDPITFQNHFFIASEAADDTLCVESHRDAGRAEVDKCRAAVHADWDAYWRTEFADAGVKLDGGSHD